MQADRNKFVVVDYWVGKEFKHLTFLLGPWQWGKQRWIAKHWKWKKEGQ